MIGGAKRIGVVVNDTNSDYIGEIVNGINSYCKEEKTPLFVFSIGEIDYSYRPFGYQQMSLYNFCNKNNVDGLIVCSSVIANHVENRRLEQFVKSLANLPLVSVGTKISGVTNVLCDSRIGIEEILDDFICNHGRNKFCLLGSVPNSFEAQERTEIIKKYLKSKGRRFDETCIIGGAFSYENAMQRLSEYWEKKGSFDFDAVFALNDDMAFAAMDFLARHNINVPKQVSVAGFDDVPRARCSRPTLTTVNQRLFEQGRRAAEALFKQLDGKRVSDEILVSPSACFRQSCSCVSASENALTLLNKDGNRNARTQSDSDGMGTEWLEKKTQLHVLNDFLISLEARINIAKFRKMFKGFAERFGISAAAVCVYNAPLYIKEDSGMQELPDGACILASYDSSRDFIQNINEEPIPFNPRERLLPENVIDTSSGMYGAWILSNCEAQYGYLIYRKGAFEDLVYSIMCSTFSKIVSEAWESSKAEKEARVRREAAARLNLISKTDELTGLLNRRGFLELGQQTIDIAVTLNQGGMVIFGDMDGLKKINDTYGHDAGDRAIKAEADILKKNFRASDVVGRIGGDEFVILAAGLEEPRLSEIRQNIEAACRAWGIVHNERFDISISLGCKEFTKDLSSLEDILKEADGLLYEEKKVKKNARH